MAAFGAVDDAIDQSRSRWRAGQQRAVLELGRFAVEQSSRSSSRAVVRRLRPEGWTRDAGRG